MPDLSPAPSIRRRLFQVIFGLAATLSTTAALRPVSAQPFWGVHDKLLHGLVFFGLATLFTLARGKFGWRSAALLAGGGLVVESLQVLQPTRQFSLLDLTANMAGIMVFWVGYRWLAPTD